MANHLPEISATLKPQKIKEGTAKWLTEAAESFALMGAFLWIIHPELYLTGRRVFHTMAQHPTMVREGIAVLDVLSYWTSPFSGYSIISNRMTPFHRDNYSRSSWYDFLIPLGPYSGARLVFANLNVEVQYDSGTMVAFLGKILRHAVPPTEGDRVCIAQYMRDNVHARAGVPAPSYVVWGEHYTVAPTLSQTLETLQSAPTDL